MPVELWMVHRAMLSWYIYRFFCCGSVSVQELWRHCVVCRLVRCMRRSTVSVVYVQGTDRCNDKRRSHASSGLRIRVLWVAATATATPRCRKFAGARVSRPGSHLSRRAPASISAVFLAPAHPWSCVSTRGHHNILWLAKKVPAGAFFVSIPLAYCFCMRYIYSS